MNTDRIRELAGHREVSPWVMKLVLDAVEETLEEAAKLRENMGALDAMEGEEVGSAAMVRVADRAFDLYEAAIRGLK